MGDVLAGANAAWQFDADALVIRYGRGRRNPRLLQALGERRIPYAALTGIELGPGSRGTAVLRALPRQGADPLIEAAGGQLKETADPYRLVLPAARRALAETYADELHARLDPEAGPADRYLVAPPAGPRSFKAYDATAVFDGRAVTFRWFWTGASSAKWRAGDQRFPIRELTGVDWRSPERRSGYLRLRRADAPPSSESPDEDPTTVVFGLGYGPVHESLPFAAAVLAAVQASGPAVPSALGERPDPGGIADRLRHLGALHASGLLTDEEFRARRAELLAEF